MRFDLNQRDHPDRVSEQGLKHLEKLFKRKLAAFKLLVADRVFKWQVPDAGKEFGSLKHPYFSGYFRANWDVSLGTRREQPLYGQEYRKTRSQIIEESGKMSVAWDYGAICKRYDYLIYPDRVLEYFNGASAERLLSAPILIYNNTWYGKWLNNGGYNAETYLMMWPRVKDVERRQKNTARTSAGSRFMEICYNHFTQRYNYKPLIHEARIHYDKYVPHD